MGALSLARGGSRERLTVADDLVQATEPDTGPGTGPGNEQQNDASPARPRPRPWLRRAGGRLRATAPWSLPLLAGAVAAVAAIALLSTYTVQIGPATVRLEARPALLGSSTLSAPPFGTVSARTHAAPLGFEATLRDVDVAALSELVQRGGYVAGEAGLQSALAPLERQAIDGAVAFLVRLAVVGMVGGLAGVVLLRDRTRVAFARSALGGTLATLLLLVPAVATYNVGAFSEPTYTGALEYAPTLVGDVQTGIDRLETLRAEMVRVSANLQRAYDALGAARPAIADDTIRFLHISDLHLNPSGFDLAQRLAEQFEVDAVIDTGDMGTWGLPFEEQVPSQIAGFDVPYVFVRGNHDSAAVERAVAAVPNARVLDHTSLRLAGINFYGVGDPVFSVGQGHRADDWEDLKIRRSSEVADELKALADPADVLLVHDVSLSRHTAGVVPTVKFGHYHRFISEETNGTRFLGSGTTGAAGPDGLKAEERVPHEAEVVYFDRGTRRPVAVDRITVRSLEGSFSVDRELLPEGENLFVLDPVEVPPGATPTPGEPERVVDTPQSTPAPEQIPTPAAPTPEPGG